MNFAKALSGGFAALALGALAAAAGGAQAAGSPWVGQEEADLRLIAAGAAAGEGETLRLGLHFRIRPGWKIYWRSPGDAGYPPSIDWTGSDNLGETAMRWPVPHRFSLFGLETFGYSDEVVLPIDARVERPGAPVSLRAKVDYLICDEICIPRQASLALDLPAGPAGSSPEAALIERFAALVPGDGSAVGLALEEAVLTGSLETPALRVVARSTVAFADPDVLIEGPPGYTFGKPEARLRDDAKTAILRVPVVPPGEGVLEGKRITVTVTDGLRGMERTVVARYAGPSGPAGATPAMLAGILGLALLGGLILNLMPCVLPVLSLKLLSVVKYGGRDRREVRAGFLASAAGILASFLVLAGAAITLKALGLSVGWGIQFQQPLFLTAMAVVVTVFACNLFGFFEIYLPGRVQGLALAGAPGGGPGARAGGLSGHFLTGAFATLLATPCSAPFLGTAIGFALARGAGEILLIFAALGIGLALPYLAIAALPGLASWLPRPGPWMVTLRRIMGLALAATAAWLLSVLAAQIGLGPAAAVAALLLALGLVLWLGRAARERRFAIPALAGLFALAAFVAPAGFDSGAVAPARPAATAPGSVAWQPFELARIPALVAAGTTVFVDVTADWCITCQVNKALVLEQDPVRARLNGGGVVAMRADWTLPSEAILRYLESFGRYGIPFDAVYGPGAPGGQALPELLTIEAVIAAMDRAAGG